MRLKTSEPRYDFAIESAYDFIIEQNINSLPVDPFELCKKNNWNINTIQDLCIESNANYSSVSNIIKTDDGLTFYCPNSDEYSIVYNEYSNYGRIRWTIAHEIGHIVLNHLKDVNTTILKGSLSQDDYEKYDQEAQCFAGILLAPPIILRELGVLDAQTIKIVCDLSNRASESRSDFLNNNHTFYKFEDYRETLINQFYNFIYFKKCSNCGNEILNGYNYCNICGHKEFIRGKTNLIFKGLELNSLNKTKMCPVCSNEHTNIIGPFCQICGTYIKNYCDTCNIELDGSSRYCSTCGNKTHFLKSNFLSPWNETLDSYSNDNANIYDYDDDDDIPFG